MARFWRPATKTAVSSSGRRANSVRQRLYLPGRNPPGCLGGRPGSLRPERGHLPPEPGPTGPSSVRGLTPQRHQGTSRTDRTKPRPRHALNSDMTVSRFRDEISGFCIRSGRIGQVAIALAHLYCKHSASFAPRRPAPARSRTSCPWSPDDAALRARWERGGGEKFRVIGSGDLK